MMNKLTFPLLKDDTAEPDSDRRKLLTALGWGSLAIVAGTGAISTLKFMFPRVLFEPPAYYKIGPLGQFVPTDQIDAHGVSMVLLKWKKSNRTWIVLEQDKMYAIFAKCTHLGCTPSWYEDDRTYKCPCHGSEFYSNGVNFAGPAPRPMDRFKVSIADDGQVVVDTSTLFTFKDFDNPNAFVDLKQLA
jgi:cytochrome b6-f complex iron-sulfur subunit